jgi:hypothetical protein
MKGGPRKALLFRLDEEDHKKLMLLAEYEKLSVAAVLRRLIRKRFQLLAEPRSQKIVMKLPGAGA